MDEGLGSSGMSRIILVPESSDFDKPDVVVGIELRSSWWIELLSVLVMKRECQLGQWLWRCTRCTGAEEEALTGCRCRSGR